MRDLVLTSLPTSSLSVPSHYALYTLQKLSCFCPLLSLQPGIRSPTFSMYQKPDTHSEPRLKDHLLQEGVLESLEDSNSPLSFYNILIDHTLCMRHFILPCFLIICIGMSNILSLVTVDRFRQKRTLWAHKMEKSRGRLTSGSWIQGFRQQYQDPVSLHHSAPLSPLGPSWCPGATRCFLWSQT